MFSYNDTKICAIVGAVLLLFMILWGITIVYISPMLILVVILVFVIIALAKFD